MLEQFVDLLGNLDITGVFAQLQGGVDDPWTTRAVKDMQEGIKSVLNVMYWWMGWTVATEFLPSRREYFSDGATGR